MPLVSYKDADLDLNFQDDEITRIQTAQGELVTVTLDNVVDAFTRTFTLVVPSIRLPRGQEVEFTTLGVETTDRSGAFVPAPGPVRGPPDLPGLSASGHRPARRVLGPQPLQGLLTGYRKSVVVYRAGAWLFPYPSLYRLVSSARGCSRGQRGWRPAEERQVRPAAGLGAAAATSTADRLRRLLLTLLGAVAPISRAAIEAVAAPRRSRRLARPRPS